MMPVQGVAPEASHPGPVIARHWSGGSQAIPVDGGRLALVHEAVDFEDGGRVYTHRWIWFDPAWRLARRSSPFVFHDRGVEYAAGLARRGDDLVVSYGIWDREAWLATLPLEEVLPLLAPPLDPEEAAAGRAAAASAIGASPPAPTPVHSAHGTPRRAASRRSAGA